MKVVIILAFIVALLAPEAHARTRNEFQQNSEAAFAKPEKDGFFFYRDKNEAVTPEAQAKSEKPAPEPERFNGKIPWEAVERMHPDDFAKLVDDVQKWSIQDPQPERLKDYMTLQRVAILRSENYSRAWAQVLKENPALDPTVSRPPTRIGSRVEAQIRSEETSTIIGEMKDQMGILFFTRTGCRYCDEQRTILLGFMENWGWQNIQEINVNEFPDAAAEYGVQLVPDLFVVGNVGDDIRRQRLRAGLTTRQEIEAGLAEAYSQWFLGRSYLTPQEAESEAVFLQFLQKQLENSTKPPGGQTIGVSGQYQRSSP